MLTIIHGEDSTKSREYFFSLHKPLFPILDGNKITLTDLMQIFEGGGLFAEEKSIFIERFFEKRKAGKDLESLTSFLTNHAQNHQIYLWEEKEITKKMLSLLPTATIRLYPFPKLIFTFLDNLRPGNQQLIVQFHALLQVAEVEFVFFMLARHIRILLALSTSPAKEPIDEVKRLSPWQKTKLEKQKRLFTQRQLLSLYKNLYQLDAGYKTGGLFSLTKSIDILLVDL